MPADDDPAGFVQPIHERLPGIVVPRVAGWAAVVDAFLAGYRGNTLANYRGALGRWTVWCETNSIDPLTATRAHVQHYVGDLQDLGRKPRTIALGFTAIAGAYKWAEYDGVIDRNPTAGIRRPKVDRESPRQAISQRQLAALVGAARAAGTLEFALMLLLGLNGLRVSEACSADVTDLATVDVEGDDEVRILGVTRKGGKHRLQPLAPATAAAIDEHVGRRAAGPLLEHDGRRLDRRDAWRIVRGLGETAAIPPPGVSPHVLRHTFATLARKKYSRENVQLAMDHESSQTTALYDHSLPRFDQHPTRYLAELLGLDEP